jgi:hypothetical protein
MPTPMIDEIAELAQCDEAISDEELAVRLAALRGSRNSFMAVKKPKAAKRAKKTKETAPDVPLLT